MRCRVDDLSGFAILIAFGLGALVQRLFGGYFRLKKKAKPLKSAVTQEEEFAPILLFPGTTAPCAARLQLNQGHHHDPR